MACIFDYIEHLSNLLSSFGDVRYRKMMGDYVRYPNEKCIITACDNVVFIKKLPCLEEMMHDAEVVHMRDPRKRIFLILPAKVY